MSKGSRPIHVSAPEGLSGRSAHPHSGEAERVQATALAGAVRQLQGARRHAQGLHEVRIGADIDSLEQASRYLGHCRDVLKVCTPLPFSLRASPLKPTQSLKTGLRVRNRKCQILAHPSNVRKFYWHAPENLYLDRRQ